MPGTPRAGSYRALLSRPYVLRVVALAGLGRLGYAMLPLLLLFTIRDATASFTTAAAAMSVFGLAGLVMPLNARLIDRFGQARVLPLLTANTAVFLASIVAPALASTPLPDAGWVALAAAAAVTAPPLGPSMRAQWRVIAPDDIDRAYALDGTIEEVLWLVGPAVAGLLLTTVGPARSLVVVPILLAIGTAGLALSPWRPPRAPAERAARAGLAIGQRTLWPVLATMALTGTATAMSLTGVAAAADAIGDRGLAAFGEVCLGIGAVAGGLAWGHRHPAWAPRVSTGVLILGWAAVLAAVAALGVTAPSLALMALAGASSAPVWVLAYGAADRAVPEDARTEASTWVTTCANLGSSAGTAFTGVVAAAAHSPTAPLAAAAVVALLAATTTLFTWPRPR